MIIGRIQSIFNASVGNEFFSSAHHPYCHGRVRSIVKFVLALAVYLATEAVEAISHVL